MGLVINLFQFEQWIPNQSTDASVTYVDAADDDGK